MDADADKAVKSLTNLGNDGQAIDRETVELLTIARVKLLMSNAFFGQVACQLNLIQENRLPTAAVDGRNFYYNTDFIKSLSRSERVFLFAHEIMHCAMDHMTRRNERYPQYWNMAADYVINHILTRDGVGTMPKIGLYDKRFADMTTEQVYDILVKEKPPVKLTLDFHIDMSGQKDGEGGQSITGNNGEVKLPKDLADKLGPTAAKELAEEIKSKIMSVAMGQQAGKLPGEIARMLSDILEPKISWRDLLDLTMKSLVKIDRTFLRPNRKTLHTGIILPGMVPEETVNVCIAIDCSGSIDKDTLNMFLSEIYGLTEQFNTFKIKVWAFDTKVSDVKDFDENNGDEIPDYQTSAGGGTAIAENWEFMKREGIEPEKFIIFTDGYDSSFGDPNYCDTVWIIFNNPNFQFPHGIGAHMDSNYERKNRSS